MSIKVGLNGFGRIGRDVARIIFTRENLPFELVQINASGDREMMAQLFKYDSIYRKFPKDVKVVEEGFEIDGKLVKISDFRDAADIPRKENQVDLVIDSTGAFKTREGANKHYKAGAKKVIITAPAEGADITIVMGVNEDKYYPKNHNYISNASCTTNCLAPITKVIMDNFGVESGLMTTTHAYTNDQRLLDTKHKKDMRRMRAAAQNIIPTSTGAAKAVGLVIPELDGKLKGFAFRVPVPTGSVVDVTYVMKKEATVEQIKEAVKKASENEMKGILEYSDLPLVSTDIIGNPHSSIFDSELTIVQDKTCKMISRYDNEWGYSNRVVDLAAFVAEKM